MTDLRVLRIRVKIMDLVMCYQAGVNVTARPDIAELRVKIPHVPPIRVKMMGRAQLMAVRINMRVRMRVRMRMRVPHIRLRSAVFNL